MSLALDGGLDNCARKYYIILRGGHKAREEENMDAKQIPGLSELEAAAEARAQAQYRYDRASGYGYPVREAQALDQAEETYKAMVGRYPMAAAYRKAQSWERASNYAKSAAGRRACQRILAGEDYAVVISEMEAEWSQAASRAVDNA